jgi:hypothetical protein
VILVSLPSAHITQLRNILDSNIIEIIIGLVLNEQISFMKQQFFMGHRYTILQETEILDRSLIDQHVSMLCFYENVRASSFFVDTAF